MDIQTEAMLLTAESRPYSVDGNTGTSHKIRLNVAGEIYVCKSDEAQVAALKSLEGKSGLAQIKVNSRKENMSLQLVSFSVKK